MKSVVLLIPGLMCDRKLWSAQCAALADQAHVVVPNLFGFDSLAAMAESAIRDMPERFSVVGHSMGARVALEVWRMATERVERLAVLDSGAHPRGRGERAKRLRLIELARREGMDAVARAWIPGMVHPDRLGDANLMDEIRAMVVRCPVDDFEGQQHALLNRPDARPWLPEIRCPTLVACGRQDAWAPPAQHEEMAAAIPGAKFAVIEDCGHMSPMERPQAVAKLLRGWLH